MNLRNSYLQGLQNFYNSKAPKDFIYVKGMNFNGTENLSPESEVFIKNRKIHIDNFYMYDHPVTQNEFKTIFPEGYKPFFERDVAKGEVQGSRPADGVSWYDAIAYCNKRSVMEGLTPCYTIPGVTDMEGFSWENFAYSSIPFYNNVAWDMAVYDPSADGYRLPTEAEWEYAARGGMFLESFEYSGSDDVNEVAWYYGNSLEKMHEVKKKTPNRLGLYDMSGNVREWCWDWNGIISMSTPGTGNTTGFHRALRSGGWYNSIFYCTVSYRSYDRPSIRNNNFGFRVVRFCSN